jgi:sulfate transport system permease protein
VRWLLVGLALAFLGLFLLVPLAVVFGQAFAKGPAAYFQALGQRETQAALRLTLVVVALVVPLNTAFGIAAAWALARFEFPGKSTLTTLIDLPFAVSPVIAGLVFVLLFGARGLFGPWLDAHGVKIIFAVPGIVLATAFVTVPFVARELLPTLRAGGTDAEEAALLLGASGWQTLWRITLPEVRWGLLYGVILCTARAVGEFGAVSVVSGKIRGQTSTLPLHVEILYNEYQFAAAFAVASVLTLMALATLVLRQAVLWRDSRRAAAAAPAPPGDTDGGGAATGEQP